MGIYDGSRFHPQKETEFGSHRQITAEMLLKFNNNDLYLNSKSNELFDLSPVSIRSVQNPVNIDENKSYGVRLSQDNTYLFDDETTHIIDLQFDNPDIIESTRTTSFLNTKTITSWNVGAFENPLKDVEVSTIDKSTRDYGPYCKFEQGHEGEYNHLLSDNMVCNEHWYIGFNKSRVYKNMSREVKSDRSVIIPSVCRAQSFKALKTGLLESINLNMKVDRTPSADLYVEIVETSMREGDTNYPATALELFNKEKHVLASRRLRFNNTVPEIINIKFFEPAHVEEGKTYAIVLRSPYCNPKQAYYIGGWSKYGRPLAYRQGDAFLSEDNGWTWIRYGKGDGVQSDNAPQDFCFQCHISETSTITERTNRSNVYFKPIHCPGVTSAELKVNDSIPDGTSIGYYITSEEGVWHEVNAENHWTVNYEEPVNMIIIAVHLEGTSTATPQLKGIQVVLSNEQPLDAVLRTKPFIPDTTGILSSSVYSGINAPYEVSDNRNDYVHIDIVEETPRINHMRLIFFEELLNYCFIDEIEVLSDTISEIISIDDEEQRNNMIRNFINNHPLIFNELRDCNTYLLYKTEDDNTKIVNNKIYLKDSPAYPIISLSLQIVSEKGDSSIHLAEWHDYDVDYEEDTITFSNRVLSMFQSGDLVIKYNPLFIKDLTNKEMPLRLDLFTESFIISPTLFDTKNITYTTRSKSVNPIREILLHPNTDNEVPLTEEEDYTVDYDSKLIRFKRINRFKVGDKIQIKYTPYLIDESISLMYYLHRAKKEDKITIKPCWFETKV